MPTELRIGNRFVGPGHPVFVVAELSANHNQSFDEAVRLIEAAHAAGADSIKLQTYTADTLTIRSDKSYFRVGGGTLWDGRTLHDLYSEAYTPYDWQPKLKEVTERLGMQLFSTPFDDAAVDFLEQMGVPAHKIASFELIDLPLIRKVARTGKPLIMSTGMATLSEIEEAVKTARAAGASEIALLKCNSAYPAPPEEMNLRTIPHMVEAFDTVVGLSDHTLGGAVAIAAVALGAVMVEKHFTMSRSNAGPDSAFSMEPAEFRQMVEGIRLAEKAVGKVSYGPTSHDAKSRVFRRSIFVVKPVAAGELFTPDNVRSIRPGYGLHPRHLEEVWGKHAKVDLDAGTPLSWDVIS